METAAILKITKKSYRSNSLSDIYEIWHAGAYWSPEPDIKLNFQFLTILHVALQCFDAVGWEAGRASGL